MANRPLANARYVAGQAEYDFWTNPARAGTPAEGGQKGVLSNVKPLAEKNHLFVETVPRFTSGITGMLRSATHPAHMIYNVEIRWQAPGPHGRYGQPFMCFRCKSRNGIVRFEMDKAAAAATRKKVCLI